MAGRDGDHEDDLILLEEDVGSTNGPSLQNPTWDYLHRNFRKVDLQKHCRELGYTKIWVTKEKLIDMIIEKTKSSRTLNRNNANKEHISESFIQDVLNSMNKIEKRLDIKDKEIEDLREKLNNAETTISRLQRRVSILEENRKQQGAGGDANQQSNPRRNSETFPSLHHHRQPNVLLLGDENLSQIWPRDLNSSSSCNIRTINGGANIDLLKTVLVVTSIN